MAVAMEVADSKGVVGKEVLVDARDSKIEADMEDTDDRAVEEDMLAGDTKFAREHYAPDRKALAGHMSMDSALVQVCKCCSRLSNSAYLCYLSSPLLVLQDYLMRRLQSHLGINCYLSFLQTHNTQWVAKYRLA